MKRATVIVAGGSGSRMGSTIPKQYLDLNGKPILIRTIEKFLSFDAEMKVVLVIPEQDQERWNELKERYLATANITAVSGGKTRFHSVKNGLSATGEVDYVGIHDAVRPLVSQRTLEFCFEAATKYDAVVPVYPMKSSLRKLEGDHSRAVDRSSIVAVQTPQCFPKKVISKAFEQDYQEIFTDDATVAEFAGYKVHCVDGNEENIKITTPYDLKIAEVLVDSGF